MKIKNNIFNLLCSGLTSIATVINAGAQSSESFSFNSRLSPSIETFTFAQEGKIHPSLYTGAMSYNLHLYTYSDEDFEIPVSIDYCFNGYKPAEHSGTIGYGWALNCGGCITREVIGVPDDARSAEHYGEGYGVGLSYGAYNSQMNITNSKQFFLEHYVGSESDLSNVNVFSDVPLYGGEHDACPDIFRFNFLDYTGEFMLTPDGSVKVFNTNHPSGELSVEYDFTDPFPSSTSFSEIKIKTGNGYCYYFGGEHNNLEFNKTAGAGSSEFVITAWKLSRITAPNGNDVEFEYTELQKDFSIFDCYTPSIDADVTAVGLLMGSYSASQRLTYTNIAYHHLLSEIKVNGRSIIKFAYSPKDELENDSSNFNNVLHDNFFGIYNYQVQEQKLESMTVSNYSNQIVEEIMFEQRYASQGSSRMFLNSVSSRLKGKHLFDYALDSSTRFPANDTNGTDYWGFWNGQDSANNLSAYLKTPTSANPLFDLQSQLKNNFVKNSSFYYAKQGALTKIIYPTGGSSHIQYESHDVDRIIIRANQFTDNNDSFVPGGVRVAKITNISDEINDCTTYRYGGGTLTRMPRYAVHLNYKYAARINAPDPTEGILNVTANISAVGYTDNCGLIGSRDPHVTYSDVTTEYQDGSSIVCEYFDVNDFPDMKFYTDDVPQQYTGTAAIEKGNYFSTEDYMYYDGTPDFLNRIKAEFLPNTDDFSRIRGKVKSIKEYDSEGTLRSSIVYNYGLNNVPVHSHDMVYNTLLDFTKAPLRIYAPLLQYENHCINHSNGQTYESVYYSYNDFDQIKSIMTVCGDKRNLQQFEYYREMFPRYSADTLKCAIVTKMEMSEGPDDDNYITRGIRYHYDDISIPQTSRIDIYTSESPAASDTDIFALSDGYFVKTIRFTYDGQTQRLLREDYPGGHYNQYTWDVAGRNIISRQSDSPSNTTQYSWRDMVGLRTVTHPTMQTERYSYDINNRLNSISDTDGNIKVEFRYRLKNE